MANSLNIIVRTSPAAGDSASCFGAALRRCGHPSVPWIDANMRSTTAVAKTNYRRLVSISRGLRWARVSVRGRRSVWDLGLFRIAPGRVGRLQAFPRVHVDAEPVASRRLDSSAGLLRHQFGSRFGILLLAGIAIRPVALLSGALLLAFGIGGMVGTGVRTALDASAFAAAAGALLLAVQPRP